MPCLATAAVRHTEICLCKCSGKHHDLISRDPPNASHIQSHPLPGDILRSTWVKAMSRQGVKRKALGGWGHCLSLGRAKAEGMERWAPALRSKLKTEAEVLAPPRTLTLHNSSPLLMPSGEVGHRPPALAWMESKALISTASPRESPWASTEMLGGPPTPRFWPTCLPT